MKTEILKAPTDKVKFKYINEELAKTLLTDVSWKVYDKDKELESWGRNNYACFSPITYEKLPEEAVRIVVTHPLALIPYSKEIIERYIKDLNEFGFPVSLDLTSDSARFIIDLKNYEYKIHLNSTLQLIRALYEKFICFVPEFYFSLIELSGRADSLSCAEKFDIFQEAHSKTSSSASQIGGIPNSNHMVTYRGNFKSPISFEKLMNKIKATGMKVYDKYGFYNSLSGCWSN